MSIRKISIYSDGSCIGNPGAGGWASIILESNSTLPMKPLKILKGHEISTTNNRMEMIAVIEALRFIHEHRLDNADITLFSDSNLVIQTLNQGWKRKANLDLWEELDELNEGLDVDFVWVKGHAHNKWNNECDKIAQQESRKVSRDAKITNAKNFQRKNIRPSLPNQNRSSEKLQKTHSQQKLF